VGPETEVKPSVEAGDQLRRRRCRQRRRDHGRGGGGGLRAAAAAAAAEGLGEVATMLLHFLREVFEI